MNFFTSILENPVKVSVAVLLIAMFGIIAAIQMPMQLSPDVERPRVSIRTRWPGASPQEIEKEIVNEQEEQLKSVEGVVKMTSECSDSSGEIDLEFQVGTNMEEAVLKVNSQLQQVRQYPIDADKPVIRTSSTSDNSIAWFILGVRPADDETIIEFQGKFPDARERLQGVIDAESVGLKMLRLREAVKTHPELAPLLPPDIDVTKLRKFAEDTVEAAFERVSGVANSDVRGGERRQLQVIVDPNKLAARGLTLNDVRDALRTNNLDTSAGDVWEGKRRYVVRTLGRFRTVEQVAEQILTTQEGTPVYLRDVARVELGFEKPTGSVRRYGVANIAVNVQRESGSNVIDVMDGLRTAAERLNDGILNRKNLVLTQVYDETQYINSAIGLVNQNIILGSALTVIVLMMFLHLSFRALLFVPLLAISAIAAVIFSPWIFLLTLALILVAGFWFARGTLVVALAIPTSIIGTFLVLNQLGRSLNVISLAGLAFAVGMLVDNAVVVLENIFRHYQMGSDPMEAARRGVAEVWGAVLASTLTTLAVFLPIIFLEGEAGQLFVDIALAISSAVGLSLLVSVIVIPTASARLVKDEHRERDIDRIGRLEHAVRRFGKWFTDQVVNANQWIQQSVSRRVTVALAIVGVAVGVAYLLIPSVEYLPTGNRNLVICSILPPPGYNIEQLGEMGAEVEDALRPYWDFDAKSLAERPLDYPAIGDFFYIARGRSVFIGLRARDPLQARRLKDLIRERMNNRFPGSFVVARQTSLFGRGLSGNRNIDIEITGPDLNRLVEIGDRVLRQVQSDFPPGTQARPEPSLELASPELHVVARPEQARELGISNEELGFTVNALIDGAYVGDYYVGGDKIDLVLKGSDNFRGKTQDIKYRYISTPRMREPVRLDSFATVTFGSGPEEIFHRERERTITIEVSPPDAMSLENAIAMVNDQIVAPMADEGYLTSEYQVNLTGTADKLAQTWVALRWNFVLAILITYLLMAALFESWIYPFVIILSVPLGAVGGILGLRLLGIYLSAKGDIPQSLDVLTMLGFIILIGTAVNNAILIVHQSLIYMKDEGKPVRVAVIDAVRARIRPIFMTTTTTVFGLSPLVFFPGAGSELYRGLGSVVVGGLAISTIFTLFLVPTMFTLMVDAKSWLSGRQPFQNDSNGQNDAPVSFTDLQERPAAIRRDPSSIRQPSPSGSQRW